MRVLITGATGFVGGAIARFHTASWRSDDVVAICRDGDPPPGCEVIRGDIEDLRTCERAVVEHQPERIYHLAAQAIVPHAARDPYSTFESNVRGTYTLLEAIRRHRSSAVLVMASSDKAYGELSVDQSREMLYTETYPLAGRGPYDCSKSCADLIAQSYGHQYAMRIGIIRAGNIFGPGDDDPTRVIPSLIRDLITRRQPTITSDGTPVRDYLWIGDALDAYLHLATHLEQSPIRTIVPMNVSGGQPVSVLELAEMLRRICARRSHEPAFVRVLGQRTGEIQYQALDNTVARSLGIDNRTFRPLEQRLEETFSVAMEEYRNARP